ncbi:hypothetical protein J3F84DRAFT_304298 [Trichoderma pleuroticola]
MPQSTAHVSSVTLVLFYARLCCSYWLPMPICGLNLHMGKLKVPKNSMYLVDSPRHWVSNKQSIVYMGRLSALIKKKSVITRPRGCSSCTRRFKQYPIIPFLYATTPPFGPCCP